MLVKLKKLFKICSLTMALVISGIIITGVSLYCMYKGIIPFEISITKPPVASLIVNNSIDVFDETPLIFDDIPVPDDFSESINASASVDGLNVDNIEHPTVDYYYGKVEYVERAAAAPRSAYYDDPGLTAITTKYDYIEVSDAYFDNVLFLGDSRMEGLIRFGGINNGYICSKSGLNVWNALTKEFYDRDYNKVLLSDVLDARQYDVIYMMFGINELGRGTPTSFANQYKTVIDSIKAKQPEAVIVVFSIMNVTKEYSDKDDVFNNDNINARNVAISTLSNGTDIFYMDMNECSDDENGALKSDYSKDGIHLKAEYYKLLADYIRSHGVPNRTYDRESLINMKEAVNLSAEAEAIYESVGAQQ